MPAVARGGVQPYVGLRKKAFTALAPSDVRDGRALAALPGLGPRTLAKHGEALLRQIAAHPPDRYLLAPDEAEILGGADRWADERRGGKRRGAAEPLSVTDTERRRGERRYAERRRGRRRDTGR